MMAGSVALACANAGAAVAWIVPTYRNARPVWRFAERMTMPVAKRLHINKTERMIEFPSKGYLGVYTADNPVSILGEAFDLAIVEEAARVPPDVWGETIMPTLADRNGRAMLISTPKGHNWFFNEWQRGADAMNGEYASWTAPSSANPNPNIQRAAELARERVPAHTYEQEWLARFISGGTYFQGIEAACTITAPDNPGDHAGHSFYMGVDWGKTNDWTVLTVICRDCARVVAWDRFNQIDYTFQRERLALLAADWPECHILAERNSAGEPNIELLRAAGLTMINGPDGKPGFNTSAITKPVIIEGLAVALNRGTLKAPASYADELRAYEIAPRPDGKPRFSAPEGGHDDRVMSLALAYRAAQSVIGLG